MKVIKCLLNTFKLPLNYVSPWGDWKPPKPWQALKHLDALALPHCVQFSGHKSDWNTAKFTSISEALRLLNNKWSTQVPEYATWNNHRMNKNVRGLVFLFGWRTDCEQTWLKYITLRLQDPHVHRSLIDALVALIRTKDLKWSWVLEGLISKP